MLLGSQAPEGSEFRFSDQPWGWNASSATSALSVPRMRGILTWFGAEFEPHKAEGAGGKGAQVEH